MSDVFIAHVEEDSDVALEIALGLEEAGYSTWTYEVDSIPGPSYLIQTGQAVERARAVVVIISPHSLSSRQVTKEVIRAHESSAEFIPILRGITHVEFQNRQPEWREAIGSASSIGIPPGGVGSIVPRIIGGLEVFGIKRSPKIDTRRTEQIRRIINELPGPAIPARIEEPPPLRRPAPEPAVTPIPPAAKTEIRKNRKKLTITAASIVAVAIIAVAWVFFPGQPEDAGTTPLPAPAAPPAPSVAKEPAAPGPSPTPSPTTAIEEAPGLSFFDDFESGDLGSWTILNGEPIVSEQDGNHFLDCKNSLIVYPSAPPDSSGWTDYTIDARVKLVTGEASGIRVRHRFYPSGKGTVTDSYIEGYLIGLTEKAVSLSAYFGSAGSVENIELQSASVQIEPGSWHNVTITARNNEFTVDIDSRRQITYVDEKYKFQSGLFEIMNLEGANILYDDISITAAPLAAKEPATPPGGLETPVTLKYETFLPDFDRMAHTNTWSFDEVARRSDGRIKMEYQYGVPHSATLSPLLGAIGKGDTDCSLIPVGAIPDLIPLSQGLILNYLTGEPDALALSAGNVYDAFAPLREEWEVANNAKVLYALPGDTLALCTARPVSGVAGLKGLKICSYSRSLDTLERFGATPVLVPTSDIYIAIERGIIDGALYSFNDIWLYKLFEVANYLTEPGAGPDGMYVTVINKDSWDSLPADVKGLMEDLSHEALPYYLETLMRDNRKAVQEMVTNGVEFNIWPESEREKAKKLVQPAQAQDWVKEVGPSGQELISRLQEELAIRDAQSTYKSGFEIWQEEYSK